MRLLIRKVIRSLTNHKAATSESHELTLPKCEVGEKKIVG